MTAVAVLQAMATAFAERKVMLKQRQAELNAQARFLAGEVCTVIVPAALQCWRTSSSG
jgi:hypothetical protein